MSTSNGKRMQPNSRIKDNLTHQHLPPVQQQQQEELIKYICDCKYNIIKKHISLTFEALQLTCRFSFSC